MSMQLDVTDVLPAVHTPTMVVHRTGDRVVPFAAAEFVTNRLPNAHLVALAGEDHFPNNDDTTQVIAAIREFVGAPSQPSDTNRRLETLLFTDIVDSTRRAAELGDHDWAALLERHHQMVREELERHHGHEVSTSGDGFFATFDGPARAVRCACAIASGLDALGLEVRAGVHTGEVTTIDGEVGGLAVHIAARIGALAGSAEVLVSSTVKDLVAGSGLAFDDRGEHVLKGVPDPWRLYRARP
jgi:class 3 adenylate cyclase